MPIWHLKLGRTSTIPLRVHRAGRRDAVKRVEPLFVWGARAPRVLAMAPSPSRTCFAAQQLFGEAPKTTREARVLPILQFPMIAWTIYVTFGGALLLLFLPQVLARWMALLTALAGFAVSLQAFFTATDLGTFKTIIDG